MQVSKLTPKQQLIGMLLLASGVIICLAYAVLKPQITAIELSAKADIWQAAGPSTPQTSPDDSNYLSSHSLWKLVAPTGTAAAQQSSSAAISQTEWQLRGIVKDRETYFALVEVKMPTTNKVKLIRLRSGDQLPDQSIITDINSREVSFETDGQISQQKLFHTTKKTTP
jgi:hypothetical protein